MASLFVFAIENCGAFSVTMSWSPALYTDFPLRNPISVDGGKSELSKETEYKRTTDGRRPLFEMSTRRSFPSAVAMETVVCESGQIRSTIFGPTMEMTEISPRRSESAVSLRGMMRRHPLTHSSHFVHFRALAGTGSWQ
jgi:hypothetical protein